MRLVRGHHQLLLLAGTVLSTALTVMFAFSLTFKRLRDLCLPSWLAFPMILYLCPLLIILGGVMSAFLYRPTLTYVTPLLLPSFVGFVLLALVGPRDPEKQ